MTSMTVNGEAIRYRLDPDTPLLWALRDASNLTGTKYGCDSGDCGACTVIVDGRAVLSCSVSIAALEGAEVTTIEGLSANRSHPLQQAWAIEQVTPMRALRSRLSSWRWRRWSRPTRGPAQADLDRLPNRCRCGAGPRIVKAVARVAAATRAPCLTPDARRPPPARQRAEFIQHPLIARAQIRTIRDERSSGVMTCVT